MSRILITGCAGFIGFHLSTRLVAEGHDVIGIDNLNSYYDVNLKKARLAPLIGNSRFQFHLLDLADRQALRLLFDSASLDIVLHMGAQAGVRYSLTNPHVYAESNLVGFLNVLEGCRNTSIQHLIYASSSSVYGANAKVPFDESDNVDHPISFYAATKKANELMAHSYAHLFSLPCTGLRFFTVYGPWGRPDMALFRFAEAIFGGKPIDVYNFGEMSRDFTYVDDIVEIIFRILHKPPKGNPDWKAPYESSAPYRIYNIGNHRPVALMELIKLMEKEIGKKVHMNLLPMQPGDVPATFANVDDISELSGFRPQTPIARGIREFVRWYRDYYHPEEGGSDHQ